MTAGGLAKDGEELNFDFDRKKGNTALFGIYLAAVSSEDSFDYSKFRGFSPIDLIDINLRKNLYEDD